MLGYIAFQRTWFGVAETYYQEALRLFSDLGKSVQIGKTFKMLGILSYRTGRYDEAEERLRRAEESFDACAHVIGSINTGIAMGRVLLFRGRYTEAERLLRDRHDDAKACGYARGVMVSSEFLGEALYNQGRYRESLECLKFDESVVQSVAPRGDMAVEVHRRLGEVHIALGRLDEAGEALAEAEELAAHLGDTYELGSILRARGVLASRLEDLSLARSYFSEAVSTLSLIKESFELARTYEASAETCLAWSEREGTDDALRRELLEEARRHAIEAVHLHASHGLEERAIASRRLLERIEEREQSSPAGDGHVRLRFDRRQLVGGMLVAGSRRMTRVVEEIRRHAPSRVPVMITGETGTGKEIVARLLHDFSDRRDGPFVAVNCAAIPPDVFESELFGHRKGAFTGAIGDRTGLIERASGGTLFLDEISELTPRQQAKLLRVLQEGRIRRVGESAERPVDFRCLTASNVDVAGMLAAGAMREDFFFRVRGEEIRLAPLRERHGDIMPIFARYADRGGEGILVEEGLPDILKEYHWPGNVRELVTLAEGLALLRPAERVIRIGDLPAAIRDGADAEPGRSATPATKDVAAARRWRLCGHGESEEIRALIDSALRRHDGNRSAAARSLGVSRSTLYRRMAELGLLEE